MLHVKRIAERLFCFLFLLVSCNIFLLSFFNFPICLSIPFLLFISYVFYSVLTVFSFTFSLLFLPASSLPASFPICFLSFLRFLHLPLLFFYSFLTFFILLIPSLSPSFIPVLCFLTYSQFRFISFFLHFSSFHLVTEQMASAAEPSLPSVITGRAKNPSIHHLLSSDIVL